MNGIGVGLSVALGIGIAASIFVPEARFDMILATMLFHGMLVGFMFHLCQWALSTIRLPFNRQ